MSITDSSKLHRKSFHRRNDSDELDVFEAARYFSGYNEAAGYNNTASHTQKILRDDHRHTWRVGRMSLDVPMRNQLPQQTVEKQILKEKKYKQPSSPGGRLASFLNSLFNHTSSKKKKSKSASQSMKDDDESPGGRRKRRISISHFRSSTTDTKSLYSSSSSGFRTPPPYAHTPTKNYKDLRSYSDHRQVISVSKQNGNTAKSADVRKNTDISWLDEKIKIIDGLCDKTKNSGHNRSSDKDRMWVDQYLMSEGGHNMCGTVGHQYRSEDKEVNKLSEVEDGAESDSSSDLFELQNYELGMYSSGLPVYETTEIDNIKRIAPISNANI